MKSVVAVALASLALVPADAIAADAAPKSRLPICAELAGLIMNNQNVNDLQGSLQGDRAKRDRKVLKATSELVPASTPAPGAPTGNVIDVPHAAYCKVTILQAPSLNVGIGLPLSDADGGYGELQGAWTGRFYGIGGGGTNGGALASVTPATDMGFVGTVTDAGHSKEWCNAINPATGKPNSLKDCGTGGGGWFLDADGKPNWEIYNIYVEDAPLAQTLWGLEATRMYYGRESKWNYFAACQGGGGRQGLYLAQRYPQFYDGILTGADSYNQSRFIQAEQWPQVVAYTLPGHILAPEKSAAATAAAIKACEADYGVGLGIIGEPRRCKFDARTLICKGNKSDTAACLTPQEAAAINSIWDGPRNSRGQRMWGGIPRGSSFNFALPKGGETFNYLISSWPIYGGAMDPNFDLRSLTPANFEAAFERSYYTWQNQAKNWGIDNVNFDAARDRGTKIIHYYGKNDGLAFPFNSYTLVTRLMERYGVPESQKFFRTFHFPGISHCGGGTGPAMDHKHMFDVLQQWVEKGSAPEYIVASGKVNGTTPISRPICKYPDEAVYNGSGSNLDAKNFHCVTNSKEPADLAADSRTTHDHPESDPKLLAEAPRP